MRNVKRVLERYHQGELSVYDVARELKISLLHAERLIRELASQSSQYSEVQAEKK